MPRRFFRQFTVKRDELRARWYLKPFHSALANPKLFSVQRRNVVRAVAIGVFCAWIPLPVQFVAATLAAVALRANVAVAAITTLFTNPITMAPMYYLAYRVGQTLLGQPIGRFRFEFSWDWFTGEFVELWQPLLVGCLLLGTAASLLAMLTLDVVWRVSVAATVKARRLRPRRAQRIDSSRS
ncbi:MAG: DUF2062 domain-containing protein [Pseudomonadota bacterium]